MRAKRDMQQTATSKDIHVCRQMVPEIAAMPCHAHIHKSRFATFSRSCPYKGLTEHRETSNDVKEIAERPHETPVYGLFHVDHYGSSTTKGRRALSTDMKSRPVSSVPATGSFRSGLSMMS